MNDTSPLQDGLLDSYEMTPANHLELLVRGAVLALFAQAIERQPERDWLGEFPVLEDYVGQARTLGLSGASPAGLVREWMKAVQGWADAAPDRFPVMALAEATGLLTGWEFALAPAAVEEDSRLGNFIQELGGSSRISLGLLKSAFRGLPLAVNAGGFARRLVELGFWSRTDAGEAGSWALPQIPAPVWEALAGETPSLPGSGIEGVAWDQLRDLEGLILPAGVRREVEALAGSFTQGGLCRIWLWSHSHNGRRAVAGGLARRIGRGVLQVDGEPRGLVERVRLAGLLAVVLNAMPCLRVEPMGLDAGAFELTGGLGGPWIFTAEPGTPLTGVQVSGGVHLSWGLPETGLREALWQRFCPSLEETTVARLARQRRTASGWTARLAAMAATHARIAGRQRVVLPDVARADRELTQAELGTAARRLAPVAGWDDLVAPPAVLSELRVLAERCRFREDLPARVGGAPTNAGVRALLGGPSGCGKTLAARVLGAVLEMDVYRVDLSAVVNKYLGETEKNLNQLLTRAEQCGVVLLLDEGDSLLAPRTAVGNANDRYANLETNFLLQRLETFEGILFITTNARERIDSAFQRRMDVVLDFPTPGPEERRALWAVHFPTEHTIEAGLLDEVAVRCVLTGGQIRNAVVHAVLLAAGQGQPVDDHSFLSAVQREFTKIGGVCPLRRVLPVTP